MGGVPAGISSWSDSSIVFFVPNGVPACPVRQNALYAGAGATPTQCGELVVTNANNQSSVDTVTVTIGGKVPTYVPTVKPTIQSAIDAAKPGDLIIVKPGVYNEILLMWKPVRLQGVGAASTIINASPHPEGKLDPWRAQVNCLFGLSLNGQPYTSSTDSIPNLYDPTGTYTCGSTNGNAWFGFNAQPYNPQVDRLPLEGILGWDTTVNGNLAQLLQEPTLMGAYEGAGITVLGKGVNIAGAGSASAGVFGTGAESTFPAGSSLLLDADCKVSSADPNNLQYPSNFYCNPSSIDGLSITNSSQGGGGIFVHACGHKLQIANNRVYNNTGTLTGGITVGQGESPDAYLALDPAPPSPYTCLPNPNLQAANTQLPYCFDVAVNVHHNAVTLNSSIGDELFSSTPAGGGGATICTGADYYKFQFNWVCGNLSTGDGGGLVHLGYIYQHNDGTEGIQHNSILFNQSTNPTVPTNGGGLLVIGAPPDGQVNGIECGNTAADADCVPGLSDGTGNYLLVNANLIMGNGAESGGGGGIRLQGINGTEVGNFPSLPNPTSLFGVPLSLGWNRIDLVNNIIANNMAGWDGAGVSLQDALNVNVVNNTIASNDSTGPAGILFNTLGAPIASCPSPTTPNSQGTSSLPQIAGLAVAPNSPSLLTVTGFPRTLNCPTGHFNVATDCKKVPYPLLCNNLFWRNRSYYIGVGALSANYQQNIVSLYDAFTSTLAASQTVTGQCPATDNKYWDLGVRGDLGP